MDVARLVTGVVLLWGLTLLARADEPVYIDEIRFVGNEVTKPQILRQELCLREGEPLDPDKLACSRQAIKNLGLFSAVRVELLEEEGRQLVQFSVVERYFLLPIPMLGTRSGGEQFNYGIELRWDNLAGLNQRLKLSHEHRTAIDGNEKLLRVSELSYRYPRMLGSWNDLHAAVGVRSQEQELDRDEEGMGGFTLQRTTMTLGVRHWLRQEHLRGWFTGLSYNAEARRYLDPWGVGQDYPSASALELHFLLGYEQISEYPYHREGRSYGYSLSESSRWLGSDFSYTRHLLYWRNYHPIEALDANLNTQLRLGVASGSSFGDGAYTLGGNNLRGYQTRLGPGNAMLQLNLEYHQRISGYRQLRAVVFGDVGNVWQDRREMDRHGFHPSLGFGLRWRVQHFVDTTLRMDYGYGLRQDERRYFFSTSASF